MPSMTNETERLQILEMIEKGVISAAEGVRLLNSLQDIQGEPDESATPQTSQTTPMETGPSSVLEVTVEEPSTQTRAMPAPSDFNAETRKWRRWWWIPLTIGIGITVVSGLLMFSAYQSGGFGFWFACLWFPLLFGIVIISLAAASRTARWLHVRVQQEAGEWPKTIAISLPIPIRFTAWVLRIAKPYIHNHDIERANLDELILALEKTSPDQPFYVKVDESDSGEKVEVYIG
jgi:hypothetical protein